MNTFQWPQALTDLCAAFFVTIEFQGGGVRNRQVAARCQTALFSVATRNFIIRPICVSVGGNCRQDFRLKFPSISKRKLVV